MFPRLSYGRGSGGFKGGGAADPHIGSIFFNKPPFIRKKAFSLLRALAINNDEADTLSSAPPPFKIS